MDGAGRLLLGLVGLVGRGDVLPQDLLRPVEPDPHLAQRGRQGPVQLEVPVQELCGGKAGGSEVRGQRSARKGENRVKHNAWSFLFTFIVFLF